MLGINKLNVIMLSVYKFSDIMLSAIVPNVIMPSVVMLSVIMTSVFAPPSDRLTFGVKVIKLFYSLLPHRTYMLDRSSFARFYRLAKYLWV